MVENIFKGRIVEIEEDCFYTESTRENGDALCITYKNEVLKEGQSPKEGDDYIFRIWREEGKEPEFEFTLIDNTPTEEEIKIAEKQAAEVIGILTRLARDTEETEMLEQIINEFITLSKKDSMEEERLLHFLYAFHRGYLKGEPESFAVRTDEEIEEVKNRKPLLHLEAISTPKGVCFKELPESIEVKDGLIYRIEDLNYMKKDIQRRVLEVYYCTFHLTTEQCWNYSTEYYDEWTKEKSSTITNKAILEARSQRDVLKEICDKVEISKELLEFANTLEAKPAID